MVVAPVVVELDEPDELDLDALVLQPARLTVQRYVHLTAVGTGESRSVSSPSLLLFSMILE